MKKFLAFFSLVLIVNFATAQDFKDAVSYLDYINQKFYTINKSFWRYLRTSAHSTRERKQLRKRQDFIKTLQKERDEIAQMPPFEGNSQLRDSIVAYLNFAIAMTQGDLAKLEKLQALSSNSYQDMLRYLRKQSEVEHLYSKRFDAAEAQLKKFAAEHNINLIESDDKLAKKVKKANEVIDYLNKFYLIYFKPTITLKYIFSAISDNDTVKLQALSDTLLQDIAHGQTLATNLPGFENDNSIKSATLKALDNYKKIAFDYLPVIEDYYHLTNQVKAYQAYMHSKTQAQWTQEEIDHYNQLVNEYNATLPKVNSTIKNMQQLYIQTQQEFEKVYQQFKDKHVPD